ncbi:hypothetical protein X474_06705 [Dethiosulfatarculus sandiegensis]|uniref:Uncharacterized protein n=1 Tax=Dethiosulfatarculus sandiegensis TaxID=1429043 RepID=A0A0D2J9L6_9BACT|nr:hypothetical protein X474_06705 [Dethiosulfatarculus sandiegensis]
MTGFFKTGDIAKLFYHFLISKNRYRWLEKTGVQERVHKFMPIVGKNIEKNKSKNRALSPFAAFFLCKGKL